LAFDPGDEQCQTILCRPGRNHKRNDRQGSGHLQDRRADKSAMPTKDNIGAEVRAKTGIKAVPQVHSTISLRLYFV